MSAERYEVPDPHGRFRYGPWRGGRDPLAPPYDLRAALDKIGEDVLAAGTVRDALRDLLRRGPDGRGGLDKLSERIRRLRAAARKRGDLGGTLDQIRAALDQALAAEREQLAGMPGEEHRLAELELDTIPDDVAGAVRALSDYQWRSPEARQTYEQITQMLRREVLMAWPTLCRTGASRCASASSRASNAGDSFNRMRITTATMINIPVSKTPTILNSLLL